MTGTADCQHARGQLLLLQRDSKASVCWQSTKPQILDYSSFTRENERDLLYLVLLARLNGAVLTRTRNHATFEVSEHVIRCAIANSCLLLLASRTRIRQTSLDLGATQEFQGNSNIREEQTSKSLVAILESSTSQ